MTTQSCLKTYLKAIQENVAHGNYTEHTHRPAMKALIEGSLPDSTATNEPRRVACGAPDFAITGPEKLTIGWVETKDIGKSLDAPEIADQLKRYRRALPNLLVTDYLEFRWYVEGEHRATARLAHLGAGGKLTAGKGESEAVATLLDNFLAHKPQPITSPAALATHLARLAHMIRDIIVSAFEQDQASDLLLGWRESFAQTLIADLDQPHMLGQFADMVAQTLAYGLFSARIMDASPGFTRQEAQHLIPKTNPFLRDFFYQVSGPQMDDEPFAGFVDDLVALLANADIDAILTNFGKRTASEDPVVYFYETFLAAYDPSLREKRGVYYTPLPVASYIVRSLDFLLRDRFKCADGIADSTQIEMDNLAPAPSGKGGAKAPKKLKVHKVLLLDPATGTATFPYAVVDLIRARFMQSGNAGLWSGYVHEHLLPRLFGFELLMAPYAVAHFKLSLQLAGFDLDPAQRQAWSYDFAGQERIGVFLTNTLEAPHEHTGLPLFTQFLARETDAANRIKQDLPVLVVFGNPPYSGHSANKGKWIEGLLKGKQPDGTKTTGYYELDGQPLVERQSKWLQDDYVKFIRWAQWRIERTGQGILAFITNHSYLDNPTFRGMRQSLMQTFTDIYVLDLHGNAKKREVAPDGDKDENVFDIQQGVAISLFVREPGKQGPATVHHGELWGTREAKYNHLLAQDVNVTPWATLAPQTPFYLFVPQNLNLLAEYQQGWKLTDVFPVNSVGVLTARDSLTIRFTNRDVWETVKDFASKPTEEVRKRYNLGKDAQDWKVTLAQDDLRDSGPAESHIRPILYRPFDNRFTYYTGRTRGFICRPGRDVMQHMLATLNLGLIVPRRVEGTGRWMHAFATAQLVDHVALSLKTVDSLCPLFLSVKVGKAGNKTVPLINNKAWTPDGAGRTPNLAPQFVQEVERRTGLSFRWGDTTVEELGPEDLFGYIYALLHSPTYRTRYEEFLKGDFPRVPITSDAALFRTLARLGGELVGLHLLDAARAPALHQLSTRFPVSGDNTVERGQPRYDPAHARVYISADNAKAGKSGQYFEGVPPAVWGFQVGGYQVCEKWLKDRVGRKLTYDELTTYQRIVVALRETLRVMGEIDAAIAEHGGWPLR